MLIFQIGRLTRWGLLQRQRQIPTGIWALGFVSLLMDLSSEMIHALLPLYLVAEMKTSVFAVGVIEGLAEGLAAFTRIFSGALSDYFGKRKLLAELGYGLAAVSKLIFPLAPSVSWLLSARLLDRFGKGIRGAPRDALIADLSPPQLRGASFGLRQSLDTIGAFLGPLTAVLLMAATAGAFKVVFWVAAIPAFLSVAVLILGVREPEGVGGSLKVQRPARVFEPGGLGPSYWAFAMVAACLTMARFSEAFLLLRGQSVGLPIPWAPLLLVLMNIIYALAAWPAGAVSDAIGRGTVLGAGFALLIAADLALAFASSLGWLAVGVAIWGLHMGLTQGLLSAVVADRAPLDRRGTAFGVFNALTGGATLIASIAAGELWDVAGPSATFLASGAIATVGLVGLGSVFWLLGRPRPRPTRTAGRP